ADSLIRNTTANCSNVQVFAFPLNVNYSFIEALKNSYALDNEPVILINSNKYPISNLSQEKFIQILKKEQAICKGLN
ncbi:MAG: hypothetical protein ACK4J0_03340, partial [Candidatus Anstonellaceae archaeon]